MDNGPLPPYLQVAERLRDEIRSGLLPVGSRLPNHAGIGQRFGVSRATVQRALQELRKDGYIDSRQGWGTEVLNWGESGTADPYRVAPAFQILSERVAAGFTARDVTLDTFSLTTESLSGALNPVVPGLLTQETPMPRSATLRILIPNRDESVLPTRVDDPSDGRPRRRLLQLQRAHLVSLRSALSSLEQLRPELAVSVEFRSVPFTPMQKLYIINKTLVLQAFYEVLQREVMLGDAEPQAIYDVVGISAPTRAYTSGPDNTAELNSVFVSRAQRWFDWCWSQAAGPLTLE